MPMITVWKPAIRSYCGQDAFAKTPVFPRMITQDRYEFIIKLLHVVYSATKKKVCPSLSTVLNTQLFELLNNRYQSACLPSQNMYHCITSPMVTTLGVHTIMLLKSVKFST
jgi:hypothetical protein